MRPLRSFAFAGLAAAALSAPAAATVQDGIAAWQRGDYAAAVAQWTGPAAAGDADAQFNLAQAYKLGHGVTADPGKALDLYRKAAEQGHPQAQAIVGLTMFQNGDRAGAMPWIEKSAKNGDPRAEYVLGTALFNGDLEPKDWVRAYALMSHAASAGLPQARTSLAQMDSFVPADQRSAGLAMAASMASGSPRIAVAELPPSRPGRVAGEAAVAPAPNATAAAATAPVAPRPAKPAKAVKPTPEAKAAPAPTPAPPPKSLAVSGGKWSIQLGAFSSAAIAQAQWGKVRSGLAGLRPFTMPAGAMIRLRAGPIADRAGAVRACAAAKAAGSDCFIVAP